MANEFNIINYFIENTIDNSLIDDYYVLTFKDLHNDYKIYLCYKNANNELIIYNDGLKTKIAELEKGINRVGEYKFFSEYGEIDSVVNFKKIIVTYSQIQREYNEEEIREILEAYKNDYISINQNNFVKKLTLN